MRLIKGLVGSSLPDCISTAGTATHMHMANGVTSVNSQAALLVRDNCSQTAVYVGQYVPL